MQTSFLQLKKDSGSTKQLSRRLSEEEIKKRLVENCEETMDIIKEYEDIIKTNQRNIIFLAYQQGKIFRKFKENRKFKSLVEQFKITKGTIIFKMNIVKLVDKQINMMTSSVTLNFLKNYQEDIKNICKENLEYFK